MPTATIKGIVDYNVRTSSLEPYVSPTRGAQGNALKTILAMGVCQGQGHGRRGRMKNTEVTGETLIEARRIGHRVRFEVNQISQEPNVSRVERRSTVQKGTRITVWWPETLNHSYGVPSYKTRIQDLLRAYVWANPHLTLKVEWDGQVTRYQTTDPGWKKWRPRDATSAHWYSLELIKRYAAAHVATKRKPGRGKYTVRQLSANFAG